MEENELALLLGQAALDVCGDLPRKLQEALFESAVRRHPELRHDLARFLHERHPRTEHADKPA